MSESKTPFEKANAKPEVQRWTGAVSANDGGGFVTYGDYLDVWRKVQRQFDSLDGLEHRARKAESDLAAALAERDALAARVAEALSAVHDVLEAAYHRCYPECCGRPGMECCGSPIQTWSKDDEHIMNTLGPVEKSLRAALSREEKS